MRHNPSLSVLAGVSVMRHNPSKVALWQQFFVAEQEDDDIWTRFSSCVKARLECGNKYSFIPLF